MPGCGLLMSYSRLKIFVMYTFVMKLQFIYLSTYAFIYGLYIYLFILCLPIVFGWFTNHGWPIAFCSTALLSTVSHSFIFKCFSEWILYKLWNLHSLKHMNLCLCSYEAILYFRYLLILIYQTFELNGHWRPFRSTSLILNRKMSADLLLNWIGYNIHWLLYTTFWKRPLI